ncbi:MAG: T9SS type A sorting domain-containing protein [Mariniphaga sp.]|nr:T9SS type A sorting domain-containing protein [Mariniphaga sp.]
MKTQIIITIFAVIAYLSANSVTVTISKKNSTDPSEVCNNSTYRYVASISGWQSGYQFVWLQTNADIPSQSTSEAEVKWKATANADGYIGTLKAQIKNSSGTVLATSNTITVTIKSILHLEPNLTPYTNGNTYTIAPCSSGQVLLEVTKLNIPGTGTLNPDKVYYYMWTLPAGWSANGITSTGSNEIPGDSYITASYPASSTGGTIKVKGYQTINGCDATVQSSKYATATIDRNVTLTLSANKTYFFCGDTNPITYTVTATPALPCAVYYWNNSPTATTSNTFQKVPGLSDEIVTVKVVYGDKEVTKQITIPVKTFAGSYPVIEGEPNICGSQEEYTIAQIQPGYTTEWHYSNLEPVVEENNRVIVSPVGTGSAFIEAIVRTPCGGVAPLARKNVWIGVPSKPIILSLDVCGNTMIEINARTSSPVTDYHWTVSCGTILNGQGTSCIFVEPNCNCYEIYVRLQTENLCQQLSPIATKYITIDCTGATPLSIILSPNPSTGETIVSIESNVEGDTEINTEWGLEIFDQNQILKEKKTRIKGKKYKINTSGWKEGVYMVRVNYKGEVLTGKLVVKR